MQNTIISTIRRFLPAFLLIGMVATVQAQTKDANPVSENSICRYLGTDQGLMSFDLKYDNPRGQRFSIVVLDEENSELFQAFYTDRKFDQVFEFPAQGNSKLTFRIMNWNNQRVIQSFTVRAHMIENVDVSKQNVDVSKL